MDIRILAGVVAVPGLKQAGAGFGQATGHVVEVIANLPGLNQNVNHRLIAREPFDVLVSTGDSLADNYRRLGLVEEGGINIGRTGVGVAVRPEAPLPDISSVSSLKRALLDADRILLTQHSSGLYADALLRQMGISGAVETRVERLANGPDLLDRVLAGSGREICITSTGQINSYKAKGLVNVGLLPDELQRWSEFIAVPTSYSANKELAWDFARYCGGPARRCFQSM